MPLYLFATTAVLGLALIFCTRGLRDGLKRAMAIASNLAGSEADPQAIKAPWAVIAACAGLFYLWVIPVSILTMS
jgi:hypothetical protein